jgi:THO complex subunit 4
MIKEYFTKVVGPIKRCVITYGPNGHSRGIATVEFSRSSDAATAAQKYNGVEVDRRPMKVELVVDPNAPSSNFADRIGAPKPLPGAKTVNNKPKPATSKPARAGKSRRGGGRAGAGRPGREKKKTADELDADMADYFDGGNTGNTPANNTTQATNGGDIGMDDDVL